MWRACECVRVRPVVRVCGVRVTYPAAAWPRFCYDVYSARALLPVLSVRLSARLSVRQLARLPSPDFALSTGEHVFSRLIPRPHMFCDEIPHELFRRLQSGEIFLVFFSLYYYIVFIFFFSYELRLYTML